MKPSIERLREVLRLTEDGHLLWIATKGRAIAGKEAGRECADGYRRLRVDRIDMLSHRVVFAMANGHWPQWQVDHIDGVRSNNRPANLRDVSGSKNMENQRRAHSNSKSGVLGVTSVPGRFYAQIVVGRKRVHLGSFATAEEAGAAYLEAKAKYHPDADICLRSAA